MPRLPPNLDGEGAKASEPPDWCPPMLATLTDERFSDPDWLYERKLDGERFLGLRRNKADADIVREEPA